ncbi:uncharacterized protein FIBRA_01483 [Fibroporia radiculosa]|uniref:AB hydrolase-1 domain-containing protein n=1 Tax=Fibroporia radiculosa TaxID=599839 RepID=J4GKD0_9APHY|nr:uncharacterized protein FIBRA_01483 [Fibroporia radiculosa]CCL99465.1 predicted protein [Fibroporia radiculosa]
MKIHSSDNETLGAWFIIADDYYKGLGASSFLTSQPSIETVQSALQTRPTILYFHGTASSRAGTWRVEHYLSWSSRLHANIFVVDYRGFADSSGFPHEDGLKLDAIAAWTWLVDHGAKQEDVLIMGHSLGTGVSGKLGSHLASQGVKPRGVVLLAPFSSLPTLVQTYAIFGVPLLQPLQTFAWGRKLLQHLIHEEYDTLSLIRDINTPTLIVHATSDIEISHSHSRTLLDHLLDPLLPPSVSLPNAPGIPVSDELFSAFIEGQAKRRDARTALVRRVDVPNFGSIEEFDGPFGSVTYVETLWGEHDKVGLQEGVQDVIASMFGLGNQ